MAEISLIARYRWFNVIQEAASLQRETEQQPVRLRSSLPVYKWNCGRSATEMRNLAVKRLIWVVQVGASMPDKRYSTCLMVMMLPQESGKKEFMTENSSSRLFDLREEIEHGTRGTGAMGWARDIAP
ncbi:hypothetical protein [Sphingobium sp. Leaf26]|uniref:hypothetical protein n=1 Tax=Sphingobium sp. Leaf26 TaxID=1735693 RepID=UPI00138F693A|nr:hypothetical protein [Sphingobium sp. Leaf26]